VPKERVNESADVFSRMGATVEKRLYPGMGHLINEDEIAVARSIVDAVGS
jgi:predicted esterase